MGYFDYVSTPNLPDNKGKALFEELERLYWAIDVDPETNKKRRRNSSDIRYAEAELKAALIKAAANFERRREFGAWLDDNFRPHIEAYDPIRREIEVTNDLADLKWRVKNLEESQKTTDMMLLQITLRLPKQTNNEPSDKPTSLELKGSDATVLAG